MINRYSGSCLCEQVKFEIEGSFDHFYLCHCKFCQKDTGSAHAANLFSSKAKLRWSNGIELISSFTLPNTLHCKSFCSMYGSALPNLQMNGKLLVVPAGSLNNEVDIIPTAHIFMASKANWDRKLENIKVFGDLPNHP